MNALSILQGGIRQRFPEAVRPEPECTCGAPYHARLIPFRVDGRPAIAIVPEGLTLSAEELAEAVGARRAERLPQAALETMLGPFAAGRAGVFADPGFPALYFDEALLTWPEIVFCPRMFFGEGECFRTGTRLFLELTAATVVPLTPARVASDDPWAV